MSEAEREMPAIAVFMGAANALYEEMCRRDDVPGDLVDRYRTMVHQFGVSLGNTRVVDLFGVDEKFKELYAAWRDLKGENTELRERLMRAENELAQRPDSMRPVREMALLLQRFERKLPKLLARWVPPEDAPPFEGMHSVPWGRLLRDSYTGSEFWRHVARRLETRTL